MRPLTALSLALALISLGSACSKSFLTSHPVAVAGATLADSAGRTIGTASLWQEAGGLVHVEIDIACGSALCPSITAGNHGIHFHAVGSCVAPAFSSAGAHFDPFSKEHGLNNAAGPHAGDAPNLTVGADGRAKTSFTTDRISLLTGQSSLFDADGTAIVIHAAPDDQMSQPSGNSGARVACGVVKTVA